MKSSRGGAGGRSVVLAFLGAVVLAATAASPASASTWTVRQLQDGPTQMLLWGVSCPTTSLCVAVGTNSTVAVSTNPAGDAAAWSAVHPEGYFQPLLPSLGGGIYLGNAIRGVSCPSDRLCVAAGHQGNIITSTNPTGGPAAWGITGLGLEATHMKGISCASPSLCVVVGYDGRVITSTNPTGGPSAWTMSRLEAPKDLLGVSCPTVSFCAAVDNGGYITVSTNPTGGPSAWQLVGRPGGGALNGISCPSPSLCVTANTSQVITSTDPTGGLGSWKVVTAGTGLPVKGVSCPTTSACAAVDNNADAITSTDPTGGPEAWSFVNVIPADASEESPQNGMFGISCASESLCVAVGNAGKIIASTDPFRAQPDKLAGKEPRRPHVRITRHPPKRVAGRKGGARVSFRFRAIGEGAKAARFKCRIAKKRSLRSCRSPKRYRLAPGRYAFRVFAIGPTGLKGPAKTYRFRVGDLVERLPPKTCRPGQESKLGKSCVPPR